MKITFLGAVEEVTGSKYLVEDNEVKILIDCGLFQGGQELTQRNRDPFPVDVGTINALVLTHAHIDHTGYIPLLVKNGFKGKIYCSKATAKLCAILLVDSGSLQEEEARHINMRHDPQHLVMMPLYTKRDAEYSLQFFQPVEYNTVFSIKSLRVTLIRSGHILGSSFVVVSNDKQTLTFSGDLGRPEQFIEKSPEHLKETDYLVLESTYGNRLHGEGDPMKDLSEVVNETVKKGGVLILPSFVVERTQTILYCLYQLKRDKIISDIPIYLDSPSGIGVTDLFCNFKEDLKVPASLCKQIFSVAQYVHTPEESKQLDQLVSPAIIIAGSGMADGGRVVFHLQQYISDAKNTVAFVGYQARGTSGRFLVDGAQEVTLNGFSFTVRAEIKVVTALSAHADYKEIIEWLEYFKKAPKKIFLTHGEIDASEALKEKIEARFGWSVVIPKYRDSFDL